MNALALILLVTGSIDTTSVSPKPAPPAYTQDFVSKEARKDNKDHIDFSSYSICSLMFDEATVKVRVDKQRATQINFMVQLREYTTGAIASIAYSGGSNDVFEWPVGCCINFFTSCFIYNLSFFYYNFT